MSIAQNELVDLIIQHDSEIETLLAALPQLKQQVEAGIKELSDKEIALAEKRLATAKRDMLTESATALSLEIATQRDLSRKEMAELRRALLETMIERDESGTNAVRKEMAEQLATMRQNDAALGDQMRTLRAELSTQIKEFAQTQTAPAPLGFADIYQGVLSEGVEYRRGQIWSYNGGTYLAKKDGRGDLPSRTKNALKDATWATIAAPGMSSSRSSPYSPTPTMMVPSAVPLGPITTSGLTMATARLLGRMTAASGAIEELTVGTSLTLSSGSLNAVQDIRATATPMFADLTINSTAGGSVVGSATGGAKGNGTLNCAGLYVNGMPVSSSTDTYWSPDTVGIKYTAGVNSTPIGQTTAAAGAFTSLAASGTISGTHLQPLGTTDSPTFAGVGLTGDATINSGQSVSSMLNSRQVGPALAFDGTGGANLSVSSLGTSFSICFAAKPTTVAGTLGIMRAAGSLAGNIIVQTSPQLYNGSAYISSASAMSVNLEDVWTYALSGGTGTWYKNAVITWSGADSGTYPDALNKFGQDAGGNYFSGTLRLIGIYNRGLAASEVASLVRDGPASADFPNTIYAQPAGVDLLTGDNSTLASQGTWSKDGSVTFGADGAVFTGAAQDLYKTSFLKSGLRYRLTYTVSSYTSGTGQIGVIGSNQCYGTITGAGGPYTIDILGLDSAYNSFGFYSNGAVFKIKNVHVVPLGLLCAPEANPSCTGTTWYDASGNAADLTWTTGVTWASPAAPVTAVNSLKTATPTGGTAAIWKLGSKITAGTSVFSATSYVEVEIGGVLVKLGVVTNS